MNVPNVVVISSVNIDTTLSLPAFPSDGETIMGSRSLPRLGGKGANVAVAVACSGRARSLLCGAIGEDGRFLLQKLRIKGVDTSLIKVLNDKNTGAAFVFLDEQGGNRIIVDAGANSDFRISIDLLNAIRNSVVVLHLEINPAVTRDLAKAAKDAGAIVVLNPSPVPKHSGAFGPHDRAWCSVDVVVVNELEACQIAGVASGLIEKSIRTLQRRCSPQTRIVVTLGARGVMFSEAATSDVRFVPAVFVEHVVDTTGAGDTFTGYLAAGISAGLEFEQSIREAVVASAICVGRAGAADGIPTSEEVMKRLTTG